MRVPVQASQGKNAIKYNVQKHLMACADARPTGRVYFFAGGVAGFAAAGFGAGAAGGAGIAGLS